ncbi:glutaminase A [Alkalihalobacillus deserti]|uniref:glutaminase A n=1 Tax=Alkalihalobacillus deserti TaxID=2879466 RepID=UPI001D13FD12|nr:glutaminase A [Alkalihalobacillus deserti]
MNRSIHQLEELDKRRFLHQTSSIQQQQQYSLQVTEAEKQISSLCNMCIPSIKEGTVASYIPALSKIDPKTFAVSIMDVKGEVVSVGDVTHTFTLQSVSKVISFLFALQTFGEEHVFKKITLEPKGDPYNSITGFQSTPDGNVFNPMINSGALVTCSMIEEEYGEKAKEKLLDFINLLTTNECDVDTGVYESEKQTAYRNRALAYFLQDSGVVNNVNQALDLYFSQCSVRVTVKDLARIGVILANKGREPITGKQLIESKYAKIVKAYMLLSGMYDAPSKFAIKIGVPAKSGVSGGILACVTDRMGMGILSPPLDKKGNSVVGVKLLEQLSNELDLSIF